MALNNYAACGEKIATRIIDQFNQGIKLLYADVDVIFKEEVSAFTIGEDEYDLVKATLVSYLADAGLLTELPIERTPEELWQTIYR